jgi:outer membrane protein assembly factor BamB
MRVQWFGDPGPRGLTDRGPRNPPPLTANGYFYVQGNNRIFAQDAYNGRILWSLEVPNLRRVNIPRDSSNMCADDHSLYLAVRRRLWRLDAHTGALRQHYAVLGSTNHEWGYVASVGDQLYGSSVKQGSSYTLFDGPAYWYDSTAVADTAKVCSENLFCLDKSSGAARWAYTNGVIINTSIAMGDGSVFFVDSRNRALAGETTGRISNAALWTSNHLVALDAASGTVRWQQPLSLPATMYPVVLFLCFADGKLVLTDSSSQFHLFCHSATNGALVWSKTQAWSRNNHGAHMYHPIIAGNLLILEPNGYDLRTGALLKTGLPVRGGCSTMSAAANTVLYVNWDYAKGSMYFWDLDTDQRRPMAGLRASCWISFISGQGLALLPAASAGCSCRFPLQTSVGYSAP